MTTAMQSDLARLVEGEVLAPGDAGFADAIATWELSVRNSPQVAVRARSLDDIDAVVGWASTHGVPVACRSTGHGAVRPVTDGIVLSTSALGAVAVDRPRRTVTTSAGARWRDVIPAVAAEGFAALWGSSSGVGVAGYTLAGGMGPFSRLHGFAADHVTAFDVVTPEGGRLSVDTDHEPELFWGLRGGAGNFAVVRSITHDLFEIPTLFGGGLYVDGEHAETMLHVWREWAETCGPETTTSLAFLAMPDSPALPRELSGRRVVHLRVAYAGGSDDDLEAVGARLVAPLRSAAPAVIDTIGPMEIAQTDRIHNDPVSPLATAHRGLLLDVLDDRVSSAVLDIVTAGDHGGLRMLEIRRMGGALGRPAPLPNAVSGRSSGYHVYLTAPVDPLDPAVATRRVATAERALHAFESPYAQLNFRGPVRDARAVLAAWPADTAARLVALKSRVDPQNLLRADLALIDGGRDPEEPRWRGAHLG